MPLRSLNLSVDTFLGPSPSVAASPKTLEISEVSRSEFDNIGEESKLFLKNPENFTGRGESKNRYCNILPYKKTCVSQSPYINANQILVNSKLVAIAAQGVLKNDVGFWDMAMESECDVIVSLGSCDDPFGKELYHTFWKDTSFENFKIEASDEKRLTGLPLTERTITVIKEEGKIDKTKRFTHLLFEDWPDKGIVEPQILAKVVKYLEGKNPIVHCSAGIGRTGTLLAVFLAAFSKMDIKEATRLLRNPQTGRHPSMVQNIYQYDLAKRALEVFKSFD